MASATSLSPADIKNLSINGKMKIQNGDMMNSTADYWTSLLRENLSKADAISAADSDAEDGISLPQIDEEVMNAPRRKSPRDALAHEIAARLYPAPPDSLAPVIKYEKQVVILRSMVLDQRRTAITKASERNARFNWIKRISKQGPWNEANDPVCTTVDLTFPVTCRSDAIY